MKRFFLVWFFCISCLASTSFFSQAATVAQIRLNCLSVRIQPATSGTPGSKSTLEFTTDSSGTGDSNGELAPLPVGGLSSHGSFFRISGDAFSDPVNGSFFVDVPNASDANTNGIPDFFEMDLAVLNATTTGSFDSVDQSGKVTATWNRDANSKDGTCLLTLDGYNLTFTNKFEIQEFKGSLSYRNVTGETNVTGAIALAKSAQTNLTLSGTVTLTKAGQGRLGLQPGAWKNQAGQTLAYQAIDELTPSGNSYFAVLTFNDGDPATGVEDYLSWAMSIVDPNDANNNGIPDLADDGGKRLPPSISLKRNGTNLVLSISGEIGKLHQIESTPTFVPATWTLSSSVTLTSDPQTITLNPVPARTSAMFWRVKVP